MGRTNRTKRDPPAPALTADGDGPLIDGDGEADPFTIGAIMRGGLQSLAGFFKGTIDEVEWYTRAVPQSELNAIYTAGGRRDVASNFIPPPVTRRC